MRDLSPIADFLSEQELHRALRRALQRTVGEEFFAPISHSEQTLPMTVQIRDSKAKLQLVGDDDVPSLSGTKALYVTISVQEESGNVNTNGGVAADDDDASSSVSEQLVDLSLSGCCGIRSTCGGLVITSATSVPAANSPARQPPCVRNGPPPRSPGVPRTRQQSCSRGGRQQHHDQQLAPPYHSRLPPPP